MTMNSGFQELLDEFLLEARERVAEVESLLLRLETTTGADRDAAMTQAKRELHTLKGNAGMMGFSDLQELAHMMEDQVEELDLEAPQLDDLLLGLDALREGLEAIPGGGADEPSADAPEGPRDVQGGSVRVPFAKVDQLVEMQAETLIFRNRLADAVGRGRDLMRSYDGDDPTAFREQTLIAWEGVSDALQELEKILGRLQSQVTSFGMVPLQGLFRTASRIVHDESVREGKRVELEVRGGETPIDRTLLEAAGDVLGHLVRNAVIHGIESPEERRRQRKPESGHVRLQAALEGGDVRIDVIDDGGGIDVDALERKALALGIEVGDTADSKMNLLFEDGVSTRQDADLGSGRGVGLAAVKRGVERHGGRIELHSRRHRGCIFTLRLPVTTSILRSLILAVDGDEYAIPLTAVTESQRLDDLDWHEVNRAPVLRFRGHLVPLLDLGMVFGSAAAARRSGYVIVIDVNGRVRGLAADDIVGIRDIVVKGLDSIVGQPRGISGSTILGDGRVIMILDPAALAEIPPFRSAEVRVEA